MIKVFLILSVIIVAYCLIICWWRRRRDILTICVLLTCLSQTILGFMYNSGLLISGKMWSLLDILWVIMLFMVYPFSRHKVADRPHAAMDNVMLLMTGLLILNAIIGLSMSYIGGPFNIMRNFIGIPIYFAAANILSSKENILRFYRAIMWFCIFLLFFHILVAFRIFIPPMVGSEFERVIRQEYQQFLRPSSFFFEPIYILGTIISVCWLRFEKSRKLLPYIALFCSALGALLTQTRGIYGGMLVAFLAFIGLGSGRIKTLILGMVILIALSVVVQQVQKKIGVDLLFRMKGQELQYAHGWRGTEYGSLWQAYKNNPLGVLTGQGFGKLHDPRGAKKPIAYFHNGHLFCLFSMGIIGYVCYLYILISSIFRGQSYGRDQEMALLLLPVRVMIFAGAAMAIFNPVFWSYRGCAIMMCLVAISRNASYIAQKKYDIEDMMSDDYQSSENYEYSV